MQTQSTENPGELPSDQKANLRQQAEQRLGDMWPDDLLAYSPEEVKRLVHELRVHQIELEMQNEELHRSQVALLAAQARYFDLYDLAPVGYMTISQRGIILEANLTSAHLLGVTRSVLERQPLSAFVAPNDQDGYYRCRRALEKTGKPQQCELRLKHRTGAELWTRLDVMAAFDDQDHVPVQRVTMTDITARKHAEAEHEQALAQLAQAQKMETVGRLAGGIAHEFNNMLAVILMRTEILLNRVDLASSHHSDLTAIYATGQRSADLVRQLLGFARKQMISPKVISLNSVIEDILPILRNLIGEEIELVWRPHPALWLVEIDPVQIHQILTNLCINARDAINGFGLISVETDNLPASATGAIVDAVTGMALAPGDYVAFAVTDTGCGIDSATLTHIFEPFFTTKEVGKGIGLGLPMVEGIVRQNNGQIQVISEPGHGTTIHIYLPRFVAADTPAEAVRRPALTAGHGETVLVVEDAAVVLDLAVDALQYLGYQVISAITPREALQLVAGYLGTIDLLVTDIVMPEMNGRELAAQIVALRPGIQVLYVSGYPAEVVAARGVLEAGMHFLQKPYSLNILATAIHGALHIAAEH